ncbi:aquaporin-like [Spodoptera litura]|uniref:Aquaporin-like n=1 Tax=Spodoptera litura TaxID=69820 RepID=A0A9J7E0R2_SPOLT|nr:aquaporin-like [Spodoptera litura]
MAAPAHDDPPGGPHPVSAMHWCGCEACGHGCGEARGADCARDQAPGGDDLWRVALAECAATSLLVLLTCTATCAPSAAASPLQRSIASGFVVALLVQCLAHVSGAQMNPTVTLAALVWGRMSRRRAACEMLAQLAGAVLGAAALRALLGLRAAETCATVPVAFIGPFQAVALEAALGGCLALANCAAWDARTAALKDSWPLRIGVSVAGLSLVGGELTGASMNPVRSFGPALWSSTWTSHWVYWVGPLGGSVLFTSVYLRAWRPAAAAPRKLPAQP